MINRKFVFPVVAGILIIALIISATINFTDHKKTQRENQYVQSMVKMFKVYVNQSAFRLGYNHGVPMDYPKASAQIAAAGSELKALSQYEAMVNNKTSNGGYPPHAGAIANFLSFVSLSLVNDSPVYVMQDGTKYTVNQQQAKQIVLEINNIFINNINESYTPPNKLNAMFNQIYNRVIPAVVKKKLSTPILQSWSLA